MGDDDKLAVYTRQIGELRALVERLADADLDVRRASDAWSSRQIVHHLADGEALWLAPLKMALLKDGYAYTHNAWLQDASSEALAYEARPIDASLRLFEAQRTHVAQLMGAISGALQRSVQFTSVTDQGEPQERTVSVANIVEMEIAHGAAHIAEIGTNLHGTSS